MFGWLAVIAGGMKPLLFMEDRDIADPYGKLLLVSNEVQQMKGLLPIPGLNYTGGDTVTAAFSLPDGAGYEIFVAVGRPGEPFRLEGGQGAEVDVPAGVRVERFTTRDFLTYSQPVTVLFLPTGVGGPSGTAGTVDAPRDGKVWTLKSMDRNPSTGEYLAAASYGSGVHFFIATSPTTGHCFVPTSGDIKVPNFSDHDDVNLFFHAESARWVDMQIMYENLTAVGLDPEYYKKYCDNARSPVGNYNVRRTVSYRTSRDGVTWSNDAGCADSGTQTSEACAVFNTSQLITADEADPPDLEFYRIRPFLLGESGRLAAHVLDYVPSPPNVIYSAGYGRQPLWYCEAGCCHAPHMYEEWWIGPPDGDPTALQDWVRPYRDNRAAPHDIWLMAQPVTTATAHVWVGEGHPPSLFVPCLVSRSS